MNNFWSGFEKQAIFAGTAFKATSRFSPASMVKRLHPVSGAKVPGRLMPNKAIKAKAVMATGKPGALKANVARPNIPKPSKQTGHGVSGMHI